MQLKQLQRECGTCTACCTTHQVVELQKPINTRCQHLGEHRCSIYGQHPSTCKDYRCCWIDGLVPERFDPQSCGIVFSELSAGDLEAHLLRAIDFDKLEYVITKVIAELAKHNRKIRRVLVYPHDYSCPFMHASHFRFAKGIIAIADKPGPKLTEAEFEMSVANKRELERRLNWEQEKPE